MSIHGRRYHRKKYVWKLVYIFVLGYDVDFGHMEAIGLMLSPKYSEKVVGYAAVALMVHPAEAPEVTSYEAHGARPVGHALLVGPFFCPFVVGGVVVVVVVVSPTCPPPRYPRPPRRRRRHRRT